MEEYLDEEDMEDMGLENERDSHWRIMFKDNNGWVDYEKYILNDKRWYI